MENPTAVANPPASYDPTLLDERNIVWIRHGKGGKDRGVMLDAPIKPEIASFLGSGKGKTYLDNARKMGVN
jgi:hypothetical protein